MRQRARTGHLLLAGGVALAGLLAFGPPALAAPSTPTVQGSSGTAAGAIRVSMKDFLFAPATLTIHAGQAVAWTYDESSSDLTLNCESPELQIPGSPVTCPGHSTTANATGPNGKPLWDSGVHRAAGFPYSVRFSTPGTYAYHCTVHGGAHPNNPLTHMNGVIIVLAAAAPASPAPAPSAPSPTPAGVARSGSAPSAGASAAAGATLPNTGNLPERRWALVTAVLAGAALALRRRTTRPQARSRP